MRFTLITSQYHALVLLISFHGAICYATLPLTLSSIKIPAYHRPYAAHLRIYSCHFLDSQHFRAASYSRRRIPLSYACSRCYTARRDDAASRAPPKNAANFSAAAVADVPILLSPPPPLTPRLFSCRFIGAIISNVVATRSIFLGGMLPLLCVFLA